MKASARTGGHRALTEAGPHGGEGYQEALTAPWLRPQPHLPAEVGELHLPPPWIPTGFRWTCEPAPGGPCIFPGVGIQTLVTENTEPGTRHRRPESRAQAKSPRTQSPRDHRSVHHLLRPAVSALAPTCPLPGHKRVPAWAGLREEGWAGALLERGGGQARVRGQGSWGRDMDGPWRAGLRTMQLLDGRGSKEGDSCGPTGLRGAGGVEASGNDLHVYPAPAFLLTAGLDAGGAATLLSRLWALGTSGWGGARGPGLTFIHEVPRVQEQPMAVLVAGTQGERRGDLALQVSQGGLLLHHVRHGEEPGCLPPRAAGRARSAGSRPVDPRPCSALPSKPTACLSSDRATRLLPETEPARRADGSPGWAWQGPHEHSRPRPAPTWRRGPGLWLRVRSTAWRPGAAGCS